MPLALIHFGKLSSSTKTITRFRDLSLKLNVRGMLRTGKPAQIIISAPFEEAYRLRAYVAKVRATGDRSVGLYHGHIDMTLGIDFEKTNGVKKIKSFQDILDAATTRGYGGDVVSWIRSGQDRRVPLWMLTEGFEVASGDVEVAKETGLGVEKGVLPVEGLPGAEAPPPQGKIVWGKDGPVNTGTFKRGLVTKYYM